LHSVSPVSPDSEGRTLLPVRCGDSGGKAGLKNVRTRVNPAGNTSRGHARGIGIAALLALLVAAALTSACVQLPDALTPAAPQADRVSQLWWGLLAVLAFVYAAGLAALAAGAGRDKEPSPEPEALAAEERKLTRIVAGATFATAVILVAILVLDLLTGRALTALPTVRPAAEARAHVERQDPRPPGAAPAPRPTPRRSP
jgi:hypothetical protein